MSVFRVRVSCTYRRVRPVRNPSCPNVGGGTPEGTTPDGGIPKVGSGFLCDFRNESLLDGSSIVKVCVLTPSVDSKRPTFQGLT